MKEIEIGLIGKKFGYLIVEEFYRSGQGIACICRCVCGNIVKVTLYNLKVGKKISCGCIRKKRGVEQLHYIDGTCIEMLKSKTIRKNNTSGYTGVFYDKTHKKWRAEITLQGKRKSLGRFIDKQSAIIARNKAWEELHFKFIESHKI